MPAGNQPTSGATLYAPSVGPTLTWREQAQLLAAMRSAAPDGFEPLRPPTPTGRARWSDVPAAVAAAAQRHELAIVSRRIDADVASFTLRTVDDRPGRIDAVHGPDGEIHFVARVGNVVTREELAAALVASATEALESMARRPSLGDALRQR